MWLFGAGYMGKEYVKVLQGLGLDFKVIGRSQASAESFKEDTGVEVFTGGMKTFLTNNDPVSHAIIATNIECLAENITDLINHGVKNILIEKPAAIYKEDLDKIFLLSKEKGTNIKIAYNRRFFSSVIEMEKLIEKDGGLRSMIFEFTEWIDDIPSLGKDKEALERWFLSNSTHVVDLAFAVAGAPSELSTFSQGEIDWHKSASYFSGAGKTEKGCLFSYYAGWDSPGRWALEFMTKNHRFYLKPMEKLAIQKRNSVGVEFADVDASLDEKFKPGLFLMTQAFLKKNDLQDKLCDLQEHVGNFSKYLEIANYKK